MSAVADDETAAAGNGGTGDGFANGGAAAMGDLNSGDNVGNELGLGDTGGGDISGGSIANSTELTAALDGGTGIVDASGGEYNIAFTLDPVPPAPEPEPEVGPLPPPPPPEVDEFQVCVTTPDPAELSSNAVTCLPGECSGPDDNAICAIEECGTIPFYNEGPCEVDGCEVAGNAANCEPALG